MEKFTGAQLEEIKGIVRENGRNIADNSLRLMEVQDNTKSMSASINNIKNDIDMLLDINLEMRKENREIAKLLVQILENHNHMREDINKLKANREDIYRKVGVV